MPEVKKAEPVISLPRRIWRWWQIPVLAWIVVAINEKISEQDYFPSLLTIPGVFMLTGMMLYFLVTEIINTKTRRRIENEPSESLQKIFLKYALDKIRFRTIDTYRFWYHYARACKMLGRRTKEKQAAHRKIKELRKELLIIKLAKI